MSATRSDRPLWLLVLALGLGCDGLDALEPPVPSADAARPCGNGQDDDGDGRADFPSDPGCESEQDPSELDAASLRGCSDGVDNDNDGRVDFDVNQNGAVDGTDDPGCESASDDDESNAVLPVCADGIDNDADGETDFPNDPQCSGRNDPDEAQ